MVFPSCALGAVVFSGRAACPADAKIIARFSPPCRKSAFFGRSCPLRGQKNFFRRQRARSSSNPFGIAYIRAKPSFRLWIVRRPGRRAVWAGHASRADVQRWAITPAGAARHAGQPRQAGAARHAGQPCQAGAARHAGQPRSRGSAHHARAARHAAPGQRTASRRATSRSRCASWKQPRRGCLYRATRLASLRLARHTLRLARPARRYCATPRASCGGGEPKNWLVFLFFYRISFTRRYME